MVVFDAWIGNMDRHHENWAVTQTGIARQLALFGLSREERDALKRKRQFTQLFDHGIALRKQNLSNCLSIDPSYLKSLEAGFVFGGLYQLAF